MSQNEPNIEICETTVIHQNTVEKVQKASIAEETLLELAGFFKVIGDPTRIKILTALFVSEMCVCDIAAALSMSQSAISHQLRVLKQAKLVKFRRDGKVVYYSLDDDHVEAILRQGLEHIKEN